jgi:putative addiction module killer protein
MISIKSARYVIKVYQGANNKAPYTEWVSGLDRGVRARINARVARFEDGHFGDFKSIGDGVIEARFFFGAAYRVYFTICGDELIILLIGGDKSTQGLDIRKAKEFLKLYLRGYKNANKKS